MMNQMSTTAVFGVITALAWFPPLLSGARVLVILPTTYSVITPLLPAIEELYLKYGHQSTIVTNKDLAKGYANKTFDFIISEKLSEFNYSERISKIIEVKTKGSYFDVVKQLGHTFSKICNSYLTDVNLTKKLKQGSFDIAIVWKGPPGICLTIIPYELSIPFILFGNGQDPVSDRLPFSPSFVPHIASPFSDKMNFVQRVANSLIFLVQFVVPDFIIPKDALQNYAPEKPYISVSQLAMKAELHLLDTDMLLDFPRPLFPNYVYVGGMGVYPASKLSGNLKSFMDSANNGVVIVSFGSWLKGLPVQFVDILMDAFHKMKNLKFVFRHGRNVIQKENVFLMPWIPQNDLLGHHNTKVFITHCGNSGQMEAVYHGVPMLGIPFYGDQFNNAKRIESKGYGISLSFENVSSDDIVQNIKNLIINEKIQKAIRTASTIVKSRPQSPKDIAAYWIDHVIRYGGGYMRPAHLDMPFYQYMLLDVFVFLLVVILVVVVLFVFICKTIYRFCCSRKVKKD